MKLETGKRQTPNISLSNELFHIDGCNYARKRYVRYVSLARHLSFNFNVLLIYAMSPWFSLFKEKQHLP